MQTNARANNNKNTHPAKQFYKNIWIKYFHGDLISMYKNQNPPTDSMNDQNI